MLVNKRELARLLKCAPTTVDAIIDRHSDAFPIVERGSHGRDWQFDPQAVVDFLRGIDEERRRASAERDAEMQQYVLPMGRLSDDDPSKGMKPREILETLKAQALRQQLAREAGFLVETAEVRSALGRAYECLSAELRTFVRQAAREHNLPEPVVRSLVQALGEAQRRFVRAVGKFSPDADTGAPAGDGTMFDLATRRPAPAAQAAVVDGSSPSAALIDRAGRASGPRPPW